MSTVCVLFHVTKQQIAQPMTSSELVTAILSDVATGGTGGGVVGAVHSSQELSLPLGNQSVNFIFAATLQCYLSMLQRNAAQHIISCMHSV
jgi:hypothetical protein